MWDSRGIHNNGLALRNGRSGGLSFAPISNNNGTRLEIITSQLITPKTSNLVGGCAVLRIPTIPSTLRNKWSNRDTG